MKALVRTLLVIAALFGGAALVTVGKDVALLVAGALGLALASWSGIVFAVHTAGRWLAEE